jgi:hypothetical protein
MDTVEGSKRSAVDDVLVRLATHLRSLTEEGRILLVITPPDGRRPGRYGPELTVRGPGA